MFSKVIMGSFGSRDRILLAKREIRDNNCEVNSEIYLENGNIRRKGDTWERSFDNIAYGIIFSWIGCNVQEKM